jgi:uncharacterized protein (DUF1501 family)
MTTPLFLQRTAQAAEAAAHGKIPGFNDDRVLVVVQLSGGNDGLNTVIPYTDERYYRARPNLAVRKEEVLRLDDTLGFHPVMKSLRHVYEHGTLTVLQGVGYPNPDRSHFRSMEIWHSGSAADQTWPTGWLGRYLDNECSGAASLTAAINLGSRLPQALVAEKFGAISIENPALFRWDTLTEGASARVEERAFDRINQPMPGISGELEFLARTASGARGLGRSIQEAMGRYQSAVKYPEYRFSQSLKLVAQMISAELPTRVYYVELNGFDTHAAQPNRHAALLQELSEGLGAFLHDLHKQGHLKRTLVMTFSEFGRRVTENKSGGTDHGAGNVMFLAGGPAEGGILGQRPDLDDLQAGDLRHQIDFRSVYSAVLQQWLGVDPQGVLRQPFPAAPGLKG